MEQWKWPVKVVTVYDMQRQQFEESTATIIDGLERQAKAGLITRMQALQEIRKWKELEEVARLLSITLVKREF
jgi:hypothetical protein